MKYDIRDQLARCRDCGHAKAEHFLFRGCKYKDSLKFDDRYVSVYCKCPEFNGG